MPDGSADAVEGLQEGELGRPIDLGLSFLFAISNGKCQGSGQESLCLSCLYCLLRPLFVLQYLSGLKCTTPFLW